MPLQLEIGRWYNQPIEDRICNICTENEIESEIHFVFQCPAYIDQRVEFYRNIIDMTPDFLQYNDYEKLGVLMNSPNVNHFGRYLSCIMNIRRSKLYNDNK